MAGNVTPTRPREKPPWESPSDCLEAQTRKSPTQPRRSRERRDATKARRVAVSLIRSIELAKLKNIYAGCKIGHRVIIFGKNGIMERY